MASSVSTIASGSEPESRICAASDIASAMLAGAVGRSSSETPCRPMKVAIVTTIAGSRSEVISTPCNQAEADGARHDRRRCPPISARPSAPSGVRNEATTTHSPASAPTDRSMAPTRTVASCAHRQEGQDAEEGQHALDVDRRQEIAVQRLRAAEDDRGQNREDRARENGRWRGGDASSGRGALAAAALARDTVAVRLASVIAASVTAAPASSSHDAAAREDQHAIAQTFELDAVGGGDQHRHALIGKRRAGADRFRCARRCRRPWSARRPGAPSAAPRSRVRTAPSADCRRTVANKFNSIDAARMRKFSVIFLARSTSSRVIDDAGARDRVQETEPEVLAQRQAEEHAFGVAVVGDEADPGLAKRAGTIA